MTDGKKKKKMVTKPRVVTEECLQKLKEAFLVGASDVEAALVADIAVSSLYNYQKEHPEFVAKKEAWKKTPTYHARVTLSRAVQRDPKIALEYVRNKESHEFTTASKTTVSADETLADALYRISHNNDRKETSSED